MDEPLSSLDAKLRDDLRIELKRIQRELGATILYVTHDQIEAMTMADRIGVIERGRLVQLGSPGRSTNGQERLCRDPARHPGDQPRSRRAGSQRVAPQQARTVGLRTEHVRIRARPTAPDRGHGAWVEHLGDQNHLHLKLDGHSLVTLADPALRDLKAGDQVTMEFIEPLFFEPAGNGSQAAGGGHMMIDRETQKTPDRGGRQRA